MLSSPGTVGWADSPVSCIISSMTFVTDTHIQDDCSLLFSLAVFSFLNMFLGSHFFFFEYIAQHVIIRKGFMSQAKSFSPLTRY